MTDELIDRVDRNDKVIDTVMKSVAHKDPSIIHREVGIVVFNNKDEVLLQLSDFGKKNLAGVWGVSTAGHVGAGEDMKEGATRELFEELGLSVKLTFFKKYLLTHTKKGQKKETRFWRVYYAIVSGRPKLTIDKTEAVDAKWFKIDDLDNFSLHNDQKLNYFSKKVIMEIHNSRLTQGKLT